MDAFHSQILPVLELPVLELRAGYGDVKEKYWVIKDDQTGG